MSIKKLFINSKKRNLIGAIADEKGKLKGGVQISGTLSEKHNHSAEISTNALENGVTVANHIHIKPTELIIDVIVTNSYIEKIRSAMNGDLESFSDFTDIPRLRYEQLIELFNKRDIFDIQTELKLYKNLAIKSMSVTQDVITANVLIARLELQEIILISSEVETIEVTKIETTDKSIKEQGSPVDKGTKKAGKPDPSFLKQGTNAVKKIIGAG